MNLAADELYEDSPESERMQLMRELDKPSYSLQETLRIKTLSADATVPTRNNPTDSGLDLYASVDVIIEPGETVIVPTDIAIALPSGYEAQVRPRSGITAKTKLRVQLGTIDEGYRGGIGVIVDNVSMAGDEDYGLNYIDGSPEKYTSTVYKIHKGDKIAQLVIAPYATPTVDIVAELDSTDRGADGFGSSGVGA